MSYKLGENLTADTVYCLTVFMDLRSVLWVAGVCLQILKLTNNFLECGHL